MKVIQKISINKLTVLFTLILSITFVHVYINNTVSLTHAEAEVLDDNASSAFTLSSDRSLTVSVSSANIDLALTPTAEGVFSSTSDTPLTVTVSTNNATGYNLNMTTTTTDLTRTTSLSGQYPVINTLSGSGSFTSSTFENNAWGYSLDGTNFTAMKLAAQINQTTKESNSSTTNIVFGAKLNNEIPHGSYRSTITFIATTNPLDATFDTAFDAAGKTQVSYNGNNYYKMQDMSGFICNMVATPTDTTSAESTQLIDIRDNSIYWVSKLLDGRCWMTENLDFEGSALTPDDSNVTNNISLEWYDLADNSECNVRMNSFNNACIKEASQGNWYNYAGASAMTIAGQHNTTENIENICPAGWTLPTHSENNSLVGVIGDSPSTFSPIIGGTYAGSSIQSDTTGFWWSATNDPSNYEDRMTLIYENEKLSTVNNNDGRWRGMYVRCIARTDQTVEDAV